MKKIISFLFIGLLLLTLVNAQTENTSIITPDNPSYITKVKIPEYFQLLFARDKIAKKLEFIEKRKLEYEKLAQKFNNTLVKKQAKLLEHLSMLESKRLEDQRYISDRFSSLSNSRKLFVMERLQKHQNNLIRVRTQLPEPAQQRIIVAIESSGKVIQKFNQTTSDIRGFEKIKRN